MHVLLGAHSDQATCFSDPRWGQPRAGKGGRGTGTGHFEGAQRTRRQRPRPGVVSENYLAYASLNCLLLPDSHLGYGKGPDMSGAPLLLWLQPGGGSWGALSWPRQGSKRAGGRAGWFSWESMMGSTAVRHSGPSVVRPVGYLR